MNYVLKNRSRITFFTWVTLYAVIALAIFWKCKYGYTYLDEAFYPTIAYRFIQRDRILVDEWNNTQLSNFVLIPFMKLFLKFRWDFTGVYLFIRYTYTICKIVLSYIYLYDIEEV